MKLKNKQTGEIKDVNLKSIEYPNTPQGYPEYKLYTSLAELNAEWCDAEEWGDYKESKGYWYINEFGTPTEITTTRENIYDKQRKNIGNYFETKEEAELAVEKLKAWKWLKDKGFRFAGVEDVERTIRFEIPFRAEFNSCEAEVNLVFLFGGGE